jgi:hypothetical protein
MTRSKLVVCWAASSAELVEHYYPPVCYLFGANHVEDVLAYIEEATCVTHFGFLKQTFWLGELTHRLP